MPKKVETYETKDGKFFADQEIAISHEVLLDLFAAVPDLKDRMAIIQNNVGAIADALEPLASFRRNDHPLTTPDTTLTTLRERCEAVQKSDSMVCMNCDQAWDMNDPFPPACKPPVAEDRGGCDCSASLSGNSGPHHPSCPMWKPVALTPSDKPRLNVCAGS